MKTVLIVHLALLLLCCGVIVVGATSACVFCSHNVDGFREKK